MFQTIKFLLIGSLLYIFQADTGNLLITFNKTLNQGNLIVYIYNKADGFPTQPGKAYRKEVFSCKHISEITISHLPKGTYAIMIIHDRNSNGKMDRNWLGLPAEPYALSGHPKFRFGPPTFEDTKFVFNKKNQRMKFRFNK